MRLSAFDVIGLCVPIVLALEVVDLRLTLPGARTPDLFQLWSVVWHMPNFSIASCLVMSRSTAFFRGSDYLVKDAVNDAVSEAERVLVFYGDVEVGDAVFNKFYEV